MRRPRILSAQTRAVLEELAKDTSVDRYGYDLARATGLASGTLYPILIRLEERGLLEARWEVGSGRPRHVYRLTASGAEAARATSAPRPVRPSGKEAVA